MSDAARITEISVTRKSTQPPRAVLQVFTQRASLEFELTEELAHQICIKLERFLTR